MSKLKIGDTIYFKGDKGRIMKITHHGKEPLLEVALTRTHVTYLNPSQLDLYPTPQPSLNENQQEVLEWLQAYGDKDGGDKPFQTIFYISECLRTGRLDYSTLANLSKLNRKQQAQVLQLFANWVLDQEEE